MKKREYSTKEVLAILDSNGYHLLRTTKGSHKNLFRRSTYNKRPYSEQDG